MNTHAVKLRLLVPDLSDYRRSEVILYLSGFGTTLDLDSSSLFPSAILTVERGILMDAKGLFLLGALSFWLPEIVLYAWTGHELNGKLITFLLPGIFLSVYLLVAILRPRRTAKPSAAIFMVLGVIFLGTLAMAIGATIRGAGFLEHPISTLLGVLLGTIIPIYAFIAATYNGSLYALVFISILMPLIHLVFERQDWIIPPKRQTKNI
jgi:hypothetical protein